MLNWLSSKEKALKDMVRTDLSDEEEVKDHLEKLKVSQDLDTNGRPFSQRKRKGSAFQQLPVINKFRRLTWFHWLESITESIS